MKRADFFEKVQSLVEDVVMSAQGIGDFPGEEYTAMDAAVDITSLVPEYVWTDE